MTASRPCFLKLETPSIFPGAQLYYVHHLPLSHRPTHVNTCTLSSSHSRQNSHYSLNSHNTTHLCACPRIHYCLVSLAENQNPTKCHLRRHLAPRTLLLALYPTHFNLRSTTALSALCYGLHDTDSTTQNRTQQSSTQRV